MAGELERARKTLRELGKSLKSLPRDPAPRRIHRLRTVTRRVKALAEALPAVNGKKSRRLLKLIEPVRKAAGAVRDTDVMLANAHKLARYAPGASLNRLIVHLLALREQHAVLLVHALNGKLETLQDDLKTYARFVRTALKPDKNSAAESDGLPHESIHDATKEILRELGAAPPLDRQNLHAFRIRVKELRYLLLLSATADPRLIDALTNAQRAIGDWHDWLQLEVTAREVLLLKDDAPLLTRIAETVERRYTRALAAANSLRAKYLLAPRTFGA